MQSLCSCDLTLPQKYCVDMAKMVFIGVLLNKRIYCVTRTPYLVGISLTREAEPSRY